MTKLTERQIALLKHTFIDFQQTSEFLRNPLIIDRPKVFTIGTRPAKSISMPLAVYLWSF
jgi:hypothetical protein